MSEGCFFRDLCDVGAIYEEALILEQAPDEIIREYGWEVSARVVCGAVEQTISELTDEEHQLLSNAVPDEGSRCSNCLFNRNNLLRLLIQKTPDALSSE